MAEKGDLIKYGHVEKTNKEVQWTQDCLWGTDINAWFNKKKSWARVRGMQSRCMVSWLQVMIRKRHCSVRVSFSFSQRYLSINPVFLESHGDCMCVCVCVCVCVCMCVCVYVCVVGEFRKKEIKGSERDKIELV
jgi:hypothetical protein